MKLTSTKISKEEFNKLWDEEVAENKHKGHGISEEGTRFLYVVDDESGVTCCYALPKSASTANFVRNVKNLNGMVEFYYTASLHGSIKDDESNKETIEHLKATVKPKEKAEKDALMAVYKRLRGIGKTSSFGFAAKGAASSVDPEIENFGKFEVEEEVAPIKKKGCLVKLAATGAALALVLGVGFGAYKLGQKSKVQEPPADTEPGVTDTTETTEPDVQIGGDNIVVEQIEIDQQMRDEIYNAIVKNVDVKMEKEEITSTFISQDKQVIFAMTETGLYKIDLTNGGKNVGAVTNNDEVIAKLQNTAAVTENYNVNYLLGDKYADVCAEFAQNYQNEKTVESAQAFVSDITLKKSADGKGFVVAPTATVFSVDAQGNANFEEYATDKVSVQRGVQLSGIDMVAASLFADLGFTTDIYTIEDVEKQAENYGVTLSQVNETQNTTQTPETTPEETEPSVETEDEIELSK